MPVSTIDQRVRQVIIEELGVDDAEITPSASLTGDLGADSLELVEVGLRLEEEFGIEIPDEDGERFRTVRDLVTYVRQHTDG